MDGDIGQQSLRVASSSGSMLYVRHNNNEAYKAVHIISGPATLEAGILKDIDEMKKTDPNCSICVVYRPNKQ